MSEVVNSYLISHPEKLIPMDRAEFYEEQKLLHETGEAPDKYIEVVNIFIFTEKGEMIVQKRSSRKNHNPNLLDKAVGGHVQCGDMPNLTAMVETVQELQTPSIVLNNRIDFLKTYRTLEKYLATTSILQFIQTYDIIMPKMIEKKLIPIGNRSHLFFGIYGGRVKNVDQESKGILYYSLDDLLAEMRDFPATFTQDIHYYIANHITAMREFLASVGK